MNKRTILIKTELMKNGYSQKDIAKDLGISESAISLMIQGKSVSKRFNEWVKNKLGI